MNGIREWINSGIGKGAAVAAVLLGLFVAYLMYRDNFGPSDAAALSAERMFICAETGQQFRHTLTRDDTVPLHSPHSGKKTAYEAEMCYWTRDGKLKQEPSYVLLNAHKGHKGPTFCGDCDRLVVMLNPPPYEGAQPPPRSSEYKQRRQAKQQLSEEDNEQ